MTGCAAVRQQIERYDDWDHDIMMAVSIAENRTCDPLNHNLSPAEDHRVCVGSYGVMQVGCVHYNDDEDRDDLVTNVKVAYRVWKEQGYSAWTMYWNGGYKEFIK